MIDYQIHGPNAGGYHLTNLILHIISTLLLFWLFQRMTSEIWKSAMVAGLFALHPIHVESVAWIAERKDVLSVFFGILTLCFYVHYTEKRGIKRYLLVLLCFVCALMSKPMLVTLPVIMILLDYWPLRRFDLNNNHFIRWQFKEKTPFFILSIIFSVITFYAQFNPYGNHYPPFLRIENAIVSFMVYPLRLLWPYDLTIHYPLLRQIPLWQVSGAFFLIIIISYVVIKSVKHLPCLLVGWLWYIITVLPVLGIVKQIGDFARADRFTYLPSIGLTIMLVWGSSSLLSKATIRNKILFPAGITILLMMATLSWKQCGYWKNSVVLFNHALSVTKNNSLAHNDLGLALYEKGKIEEAIVHYNEALRITPRYPFAYNNRGVAYAKLGQYQKALDDFNRSISLKPDYASAFNNRAMVYYYLGNPEGYCQDARKACEMGTCIALEKTKGKYCP
jgi:tetratricopeptide (TPR) repeat protein